MKQFILFLLLAILSYPSLSYSQVSQKGKVLFGVFDGRTPCQELAGQLEEKTIPECIKIKWRLTLYKDPVTGNPGAYEMQGFAYKKGNPRTGKWSIIKGTKENRDAIVYRLDEPGRKSLFLQKADNNVLFFLDEEKRLMVGNRDFSYTLNRINKKL